MRWRTGKSTRVLETRLSNSYFARTMPSLVSCACMHRNHSAWALQYRSFHLCQRNTYHLYKVCIYCMYSSLMQFEVFAQLRVHLQCHLEAKVLVRQSHRIRDLIDMR